jgi:hypothetical protein
MLRFGEKSLTSASVVTSARLVTETRPTAAGRPALGQAPRWVPDHEASPCLT